MTINRPIDKGITSVIVGHTERGAVAYRIDKLSIVSGAAEAHSGHERFEAALLSLQSDDRFKVEPVYFNGSKKRHYKHSVRVSVVGNTDQYLLIQCRPLKNRKKVGFVRFELSPQHFLGDDMTSMVKWLAAKDRIGRLIYNVLYGAWITRIDIALDLYGYKLDDFYIELAKASKKSGEYRPFEDNGEDMGTGLYLGSIHSALSMLAYEKVVGEQDLRQDFQMVPGSAFLREELKIRPKKFAAMLKNLNQIEAQWVRVVFYSRIMQHSKSLPAAFIRRLKTYPFQVALGKYLDYTAGVLPPTGDPMRKSIGNERRRLEREIREDAKAYKVTIISPDILDGISTRWLEIVGQLGLMADPVELERLVKRGKKVKKQAI